MLLDSTGSGKSKMAASKPEVHISKLVIYVLPYWRPPSWISGFRLHRTVFPILLLGFLTLKTWGSRLNFTPIMSTSRDVRISRLSTAILDFWLPVTSHRIPNIALDSLTPKTWGGRLKFVPSSSRSWDLGGSRVITLPTPQALHFFLYRFTWQQN